MNSRRMLNLHGKRCRDTNVRKTQNMGIEIMVRKKEDPSATKNRCGSLTSVEASQDFL